METTKELNERIGARLVEARCERGMTQMDVVNKSGITQGHITKMEHGTISPNILTITKYLEAVGGYKIDIVKS